MSCRFCLCFLFQLHLYAWKTLAASAHGPQTCNNVWALNVRISTEQPEPLWNLILSSIHACIEHTQAQAMHVLNTHKHKP